MVAAVCLLSLVAFAWFASHAVPSLYFGDSGELLAALRTGGVPHPTGFPILMTLGVIPAQANAFFVNLLSSAAGALAVGLSALWARRLLGRNAFLPTAVFLLGSCTLLLHASVTRVYAFQWAATAAVLVTVTTYRPQPRWGLLFGFLLGLSSTTHLLFLSGLVYATVSLWDRRRDWASLAPWVLGGVLLGASPILWIPLRAHAHPWVSWGEAGNLGSFWAYLTQRQYSEKMLGRDLLGTWAFLGTLGRVFLREWNPLVWLFAAWGAFRLYRTAPRKTYALGAVMLFNVLLMYLYGHNGDLEILYRYFLPTYACAAVLASVAAAALWERWSERFAKSLPVRIALGLVFVALFVSKPALRWVDLAEASGCRSYLRHLLKPLPRNATVVLMGDNQVFPAAFGRYNLGVRTDLHFVEWEGTLFPEAFRLLHDPLRPVDPRELELEWYRRDGGCLFVAAPRLVQPPDRCRPYGFMYRLSDEVSERTLPAPPRPDWLPPRFTRAERSDPEAMEPLADHYLMSAAWHRDQGEKDAALRDVEEAVAVTPRTVRTLINAAAQYGEVGDDSRCGELLERALKIDPSNFNALLNMGIHFGKIGRYGECRAYLLAADAVQPHDPLVAHYLNQLNAVAR